MAFTKIKERMYQNFPAEARRKIVRMEQKLTERKRKNKLIGLEKAYDKYVEAWYDMCLRVNGKG